jgi:hypothetical protein
MGVEKLTVTNLLLGSGIPGLGAESCSRIGGVYRSIPDFASAIETSSFSTDLAGILGNTAIQALMTFDWSDTLRIINHYKMKSF